MKLSQFWNSDPFFFYLQLSIWLTNVFIHYRTSCQVVFLSCVSDFLTDWGIGIEKVCLDLRKETKSYVINIPLKAREPWIMRILNWMCSPFVQGGFWVLSIQTVSVWGYSPVYLPACYTVHGSFYKYVVFIKIVIGIFILI